METDCGQVTESDIPVGKVIARRYKVLALAGRGRHSAVYKAEDSRSRAAVALKLIDAAVPRNTALKQYLRDIKQWRRLQHPLLVKVIDSTENEGRTYITMDWLEGGALAERLRKNSGLSLDHFFKLFDDLCQALAALHARKIVHRGIHPSNLLMSADGRLHLSEPGITRDLDPAAGDTARYVAPECSTGGPCTYAADIFSLGAVCREMLAACLTSQPKAPVMLQPVAAMFERCLRRDPAARFQSVMDLVAAATEVRRAIANRLQATTLAAVISDDPPAPDAVVPWMARLAARLREVHAAGQFHRELAPAGIRIEGEKLEIETIPPPPEHATVLIRNPRYSAPELFLSQTEPDLPGHIASDVYVLGVIYYELLAGRRQMEQQLAQFPELKTDLGWMRWHADPSQHFQPVLSVAPLCPKPLAELIEKMLEKDPARRIQTLEEVESTLGAARGRMDRTQVIAVSGPAPPRRKQVSRRKQTLGAVVCIALVLAGGAWLVFRSRSGAGIWHPDSASAKEARDRAAGPPGILQTATGSMNLIPEGQFVMGSDSIPEQAPAHTERLPGFYMDRFEVSNRHYRRFCEKNNVPLPPPPPWNSDYYSRDDYPVLGITNDEARAFCEAAGKHLPSEAEWEKAARGTGVPPVVWGNWRMPGLANLKSEGAAPQPVGSYTTDVSPFGVMDMAGNVQEWAGSALRGGSFADLPAQLSPSWHGAVPADAGRLYSVGFRCAADLSLALSAAK